MSLRQLPALGMMFVNERCGVQVFSDGPFELIARRTLTFLFARALRLRALDGPLEQAHLRLVAEVQQQRVDPVRVIIERDALNEYRSHVATGDHEMAFERGRAVRPAAGGEFLPPGAFGLDDAIGEAGVEDGAQRADGERGGARHRCRRAGCRRAAPVPGRQAAARGAGAGTPRRPRGRRAGFSHGHNCALLPSHVAAHDQTRISALPERTTSPTSSVRCDSIDPVKNEVVPRVEPVFFSDAPTGSATPDATIRVLFIARGEKA